MKQEAVASSFQLQVGEKGGLSNECAIALARKNRYTAAVATKKQTVRCNMTTVRIHEQIAFLRKQKGLTQEALANALGVTNQAVSKWESAQCCPDIQLLPVLAGMFGVSVDELLGCKAASTTADMMLEMRKTIDALPKGADGDFAFKAAAALHTILFSKSMTAVPGENPGWDTEDAIEHAGNAEWGYSCISMPEITTMMRKGTVLFSNHRGLDLNLTRQDIRRIVAIMKDFADVDTLSIASAIHTLTVHDEHTYAATECISEKSGVPADRVTVCLDGPLAAYITEHCEHAGCYRLKGMYDHLLPVLSLIDVR